MGIQSEIHRDVRVEFLKIRDRLSVDCDLRPVRVILRPERYGMLPLRVEFLRDGKRIRADRSMTAGENAAQNGKGKNQSGCLPYPASHPFVPPLETPAMIFLWKIRNRTINGTEMTTTAAIMAGMFSRPNPFSRISWIPLETRK